MLQEGTETLISHPRMTALKETLEKKKQQKTFTSKSLEKYYPNSTPTLSGSQCAHKSF